MRSSFHTSTRRRSARLCHRPSRMSRILPNGFLYADRVLLPQSFALAPSGLRRVKVAVRGIQHLMFSPDVTNIEHGLFATDEFSNGYFHWVCDVLPRIETLASTVPRRACRADPRGSCNGRFSVPPSEPSALRSSHVPRPRQERAGCLQLVIYRTGRCPNRQLSACIDALPAGPVQEVLWRRRRKASDLRQPFPCIEEKDRKRR